MNGIRNSWIIIIIGIFLFISGFWSIVGYFYDPASFDYLSVIRLIFGVILVFLGMKITWDFTWLNYRMQFTIFFIFGGIFISILFILWFFHYIDNINFLSIYVVILSYILWFFFMRYAELHQTEIRRYGRIFEYLFLVFLFLSTYFFTAAIGKMTLLSWQMDLEILGYFLLMGFFMVSALCSGILHYIRNIG